MSTPTILFNGKNGSHNKFINFSWPKWIPPFNDETKNCSVVSIEAYHRLYSLKANIPIEQQKDFKFSNDKIPGKQVE